MYVCMYVRTYVCVPVCMCVCNVCMSVCVCIYVYMCVCLYVYNSPPAPLSCGGCVVLSPLPPVVWWGCGNVGGVERWNTHIYIYVCVYKCIYKNISVHL